MNIKHLHNNDIDYILWDKSISLSFNELTYAYTWFLDIVSPNWEALVTEDYKYIMPLPKKKKYGIPYLIQPILTQQLGIFSKENITPEIVAEFIKKIPFVSYELHLNEQNFHPKIPTLPNFILQLNQTYENTALNFSKNTVRNIARAKKMKLKVHSELTIDLFLKFYYATEKIYKPAQQSIVKKIIEKGITENKISLHAVYSIENEIIAALCLLHSLNRITYLLPISNTEGKSSSAMFLLINSIIQENKNSFKILDFEGSRIAGIARFYRGFGAILQPYHIIKKLRPQFIISKLHKK
jgi:hypothetical protein